MKQLPNHERQNYFERLNNNLQIIETNGLRFNCQLEKGIYDSLIADLKGTPSSEQNKFKLQVLQKQVQRMEEAYCIDFFIEAHKRLEKVLRSAHPQVALVSESYRQQYMSRLAQLQQLE